MSGLLWLLVFGALFYFMMRYGCGAHTVHGGHGGHGGHGTSGGGGMAHGSHVEQGTQGSVSANPRDPVCGMEVDPVTGYSRMYEGREYRFCSRNCLDKFDAAPERYAGERGVK